MVAVATSQVHKNWKFSRFHLSRELLMPKSPLDIASLIQARNGLRGHSLPSGSSSSILCSLTRILLTVEARMISAADNKSWPSHIEEAQNFAAYVVSSFFLTTRLQKYIPLCLYVLKSSAFEDHWCQHNSINPFRLNRTWELSWSDLFRGSCLTCRIRLAFGHYIDERMRGWEDWRCPCQEI